MAARPVELHELTDSPVFPPRSAGVQDVRQEAEVVEGETFDHGSGADPSVVSYDVTSSSQATSTSDGGKTSQSLIRKINFGKSGVLKFSRTSEKQSKKRPGSFGAVNEGTGKAKDPQILKSDKLFTVSANDMSVLERIAHRAQHRGVRVRKPHEVFVELEEIRMNESEGLEWAETARWIKFEEDVEEGSGRWGRPHISALTFHSLVELQQGIDKGSVLLDVDGDNFPAIVDELVDSLEKGGQLEKDSVEVVKTLLLKRHRHTGDTNFWGKRKTSNSDDANHGHSNSHTHHHTHSHAHKRISNVSELALLKESGEEESDLGKDKSGDPNLNITGKKVSFSLNTSPPSANSSPFSTSDTDSKNPDITTAVDLDEVKIPDEDIDHDDKEDEEKAVSSPSHGIRSLLRKSSIIDVLPKEAESLTVLVGGVKFLERPITAFVRLDQAIHLPLLINKQSHLLGDLTEVPVPVRFLFLMIGPEETAVNYHEVGRCVATLMSDAHFHELAYSAICKEDLLEGIDKFLDDSIVLPPGDWDEDLLLPAMHERNELRRRKEQHQEMKESYRKMVVEPIHHSRRPFKGIFNDFKKLASRYPSDFKDALNLHVLVSIFFLYISFVAPAIAFGGLMEEVTNNSIGETETLFGAGLGGILYGLFAVQPLTVQAFVGPVLVYESIIYRFAVDYDLPYIEWRVLIGLWLMVILLVLAVAELTFLVHYFTRFSEEVFIGITGFFFFYEACLSIIHIFERNPLCGLNYPCGKGLHLTNTCTKASNKSYSMMDPFYINYSNASLYETDDRDTGYENATEPTLPSGFRICNQPNTALWSLILAIMTFAIALFLRKLRYKKNLGKKARRLVSDFGMFAALSSMVLVAYFMRNLVPVEGLLVPSGYSVSSPSLRGWFVNPFNGSVGIGIGFGAFIPAALLAILIFIENQLALMTVNKPEHKLSKPVGYHLDLALVGILAGVSGILGLPFLCGAPVRSLQLLQALSVYTKKQAPGEKPTLVRIHEQRVVTVVVHILIIFTPFASAILEVIPISVVLGVFFYLAYASFGGVQLTKRIKLLFVIPKYHPNVNYVRMVRTWKMHLYTLIQVGCVLFLYGVKLSPGALVYPLVIVLLLPFKWVLSKLVFTKEEMAALDSDETEAEEVSESPEFGEFASSHVPY